MKKIALLMAGAAAVAAMPAHAREGRPYIGINGGISFESDVDINLETAPANDEFRRAGFAETDTGLDADIVIGYDFGNFRLEAEGGYKRAGFDNLTITNAGLLLPGRVIPAGGVVPQNGNMEIWSGMLNGLFEFGNEDGFQVFGGGGVGVASIELPLGGAAVGQVIDDHDADFAWQLLAGVRAAVSDNLDLGIKYRYFVADNFNFNVTNGRFIQTDYQAHSVLASLTYNFGASEPEPAPVVAAPPPPPPPPPVARPAPPPPPRPVCNTGPYIVFFDFDSSDITSEASSILDNAVTAYANCGSARVMLAGHTDTSGSAQYNMGLAERRNNAVRNYMTGRGVPSGQIMSEALGETRPRVPTADGVREAQNRRVEVTYGPGSGM